LPYNALPDTDVAPPPPPDLDGSEGAPPAETFDADPVKDEARTYGWVDKDDYRGDPRGWVDADRFLERRTRAEEMRKVRAELAALKLKDQERDRRSADAQAKFTVDDLKLQMKQAQEDNDWARFTDLNDKLVEARIAAREAARPAAAAPTMDEQSRADALAFRDANPWLLKDRDLARNFAAELKLITDVDPQLSAAEALDSAKQRVMRLYPERFRNGNTRRPPMFETVGTTTGTRPGRTWNDLDPKHRAQAEVDIAAKKYTREDFLEASQDDPNAWRR
jgi:hypothetical protein